MKNLRRRALSLLLAVVMAASLLPTSAWAAVTLPEESDWVKSIVAELNEPYTDPDDTRYTLQGPAPLAGSELYTWVVERSVYDSSTGSYDRDIRYIIVPGDGTQDFSMPNYASASEERPWHSAGMSTVYISKEITSIGDNAFNGMSTLDEVVFEDASNLTYIGERAFSGIGSAAFTDEGNSEAADTLDLTGVTRMGEYAFSGCGGLRGVELNGTMTAVEADGTTTPNKIPAHAFGSCSGLTSIVVPDGITTVGTGAFSGCTQANSIVLPDSLVTIEDSAFACSIDGDNTVLQTLTIPQNVVTIGERAFYGFTEMTTVFVESEKLKEPGEAAFGNNALSAYSGTQILDNGEMVEDAGTIFKTPNSDIAALFRNTVNCYTGVITPLTLIPEKSWPATCQHVGRNTYAYEFNGDQQTLYEELDRLEHVYLTPEDPAWPEGFDAEDYPVDFPETCDTRAYSLSYCFNCLTDAYPQGDIQAVTEPHAYTDYQERETEAGHDYNCTGITGGVIAAGGTTTITYTCSHGYHDDERDGIAGIYGVTFQGITLSANTVSYQNGRAVRNTLASISMPRTVYAADRTAVGTIGWAEGVDTTEQLSYGTKTYPVVFTPSDALLSVYDGMEAVSGCGETTLEVTVQVNKTTLSLANMRFDNVRNFQDSTNSSQIEATVTYLQTGSDSALLAAAVLGTDPTCSYTGRYDGEEETTSSTAPLNNAPWTGTVTMTFSYDSDLYVVDPTAPSAEYTVSDDNNGTLTVTHEYTVSQADLSGAAVQGIDRTYTTSQNETDLYAFRLTNTPANSEVEWTWKNVADESETGSGSFTSTGQGTSFAPIADAGTYEVTVTITNPDTTQGEVERTAQVTISPAPVQIPAAAELEPYTGAEQTALTEPVDDTVWYYQDGSTLAEDDAGTYTATAVLEDTRNYAWYDGDTPAQGAEGGVYTVTWSIDKRSIFEPTYSGSSGIHSPTYNGEPQNSLANQPSRVTGMFTITERENADGTTSWIGTLKDTGEEVVEVTNVKATNAGEYTIQATILGEHFKNFQWMNHTESASFDLAEWEITQYRVVLNQVSALPATYSAAAYTGEPSVTVPTGLPDEGLYVTGYTYYTYTGGQYRETEKSDIIDAGTYYVRANYAFKDSALLDNYNLVQPQLTSFQIRRLQLTLNETMRTETYTGAEYTVTDPVVPVLGPDQGEEVYTYTYTTYAADDEEMENPISHDTSPAYRDRGTYTVYVGISSQNYTAAAVPCTLTIGAATQSITLKQGETAVEAEDTVTTPLGTPITVTGTAAVGDPTITYAADSSSVVRVDRNTGEVTPLKVGTAIITVTAGAITSGELENVGGTWVTYSVKVEKGTPTVTVTPPAGGENGVYDYTGSALKFDATVTGVTGVQGAAVPETEGKIHFNFYADTDQDGQPDGTALGDQPTDVGAYLVEAVYDGDDNYASATSQKVSFQIRAAGLTVAPKNPYGGTDGKIYDGQEHPAAEGLTVTGPDGKPVEADSITYSTEKDGSYTATMPSFQNAGTHTVYYKVTADNYEDEEGQFSITIHPAPLTITGEVEMTKPYDGKRDAEVISINDTDYAAGGIFIGGVEGETITVTASAVYNNEDVGEGTTITITYTLNGADLSNYSYGGTAITGDTVTQEVTGASITQKPVTVTGVSAEDRVYDSTDQVDLTGGTLNFADGDIEMGETVTATLSASAKGTVQDSAPGADDAADAGKNKIVHVADTSVITLGGADAGNYIVATVKGAGGGEITVNIEERPVELEFDGIGEGRVISKDFTGSPVHVTVVPAENQGDDGGFLSPDALNPDDVAYTYSGTDETHTAVGDYTVTAALKSEGLTGDYSNYELKFPTKTTTLRITANTGVSVTAAAYTAYYTGEVHNVTKGWDFTGYVDGTARTVQFIPKDENHQSNPGEEGEWDTIEFKNVSQSGEYWWRVTASNHDTVYGADAVTINIDPLALEVTPELNGEKVYDGTPDFELSKISGTEVTGEADGETVTATATSAVYDGKDEGERKITITYTLSGAELSNYTYGGKRLSGTSAEVTVEESGKITAKPITVTIADQNDTYDGEPAEIEQDKWSASPKFLDDVSITLSAGNAENAGTHTITGSVSGGDRGNYDIKWETGTLTIAPRPISVKIGDAWGYYGNKPVLTLGNGNGQVTLEDITDILTPGTGNAGLVEGENIYDALTGLTLTTTANAQSDVDDNYTISATNGNGKYGNYDVTFTSGTYTVVKRLVTITLADQSSYYGAEPVIDQKDYSVTSGGNDVVTADLAGSGLTITLNVYETGTDPIDSATPAEDYNIVPTAGGDKAGNYDITWAGNGDDRPEGGKYGQYTVEKAELRIGYPGPTHSVAMGGSVNWPLGFYNVSNGNAQLNEKPADVTVEYTSSKPDVATVDENGNVTIKTTGTTTITATVTAFGDNYEAGTDTASYELTVVEGGQGIQVDVRANTLTYTGEPQALVTTQIIYPLSGVTVEYQLNTDQGEYTSGIPKGTNAGRYEVYWKASYPGLATIYGSEPVTIQKADPSTGFTPSSVSTEYAEGKVFDSTTETSLNIHKKYQNETGWSITYLSDDTRIAEVKDNDLHKIHLNGNTGDVRISAGFAKTDNFNAQTVYFTLTVNEAGTTIEYDAKDYSVPYDGQPYGARITVRGLTNYTIKYSDDDGSSYELDESPTVTNVSEGTLTIYFQIQADGYPSQNGQQKVTITPRPIAEGMVSGIAESYTYTSKPITPETERVRDGETLLVKGRDYTVAYGTNTSVGSSKDDENLTDGGGWVKITGTGNYTGTVTKYFAITPVEGGGLTASLDRYYGFYGDTGTNHATVTVRHNISGGEGHDVAASEIKVTVTGGPEGGAQVAGTTITFTREGIYTIQVEVTGTHTGSFILRYALLPTASENGLTLTVNGEPTPAVSVYGETVSGVIQVTSNGKPLEKDVEYTLAYSYQPFTGTGAVPAGTPYDAEEVFGDIPAAGLYVVTATAVDDSGYTGSGTFVFLVQQKRLEDSMIGKLGEETYTGLPITPVPVVTYTGDSAENLLLAGDYTVSYQDNRNAGTARLTVTASTGSNNFTGTASASFTILPKDLSGFTVDPIPDQRHTGRPITPGLTVTDPVRGELIQGLDFTAQYENNTNVGTAQVTITGEGNYIGTIETTFRIVATASRFDLALDKTAWTWGGEAPTSVEVTYTVDGISTPLTIGTHYVLEIGGQTYKDWDAARLALEALTPGTYEVTARGGAGTGYEGMSDAVWVTVSKIQPTVRLTASPNSLPGGGTVELILSGTNLPAAAAGDLSRYLSVTASSGAAPDLTGLKWSQTGGAWTAELSLPNANNTYTFTLSIPEDTYYESALATALVVTTQYTGGGGGGGTVTAYTITASAGAGGSISPSGAVAVVRGGSQSFAITAEEGYEISDVLVDGVSIGAVSSYTFTNVTRNHTITAVFTASSGIADPDDTGTWTTSTATPGTSSIRTAT